MFEMSISKNGKSRIQQVFKGSKILLQCVLAVLCISLVSYGAAGSRAASLSTKGVTEVTNGLLVSKPVKEPEIIDLQEYAKSRKGVSNAVSVPGINKVKAIHDFMTSNGRV